MQRKISRKRSFLILELSLKIRTLNIINRLPLQLKRGGGGGPRSSTKIKIKTLFAH
jgi:hypothetical protein